VVDDRDGGEVIMNRSIRPARVAVALLATAALGVGMAGPATAQPATTGVTASAVTAPPDPLQLGSYDVTAAEYDFGDTAFNPPDFPGPIELIASVHYPTDLSDGPYPLVVLLHGRHSTCYQGSSSGGGWPCPSGWQSIPSYQGYDYLAENLASWGYIVVSVSANGINARDSSSPDDGMTARGELVQEHLKIWDNFNTDGGEPFGDLFVGKVDMQNIGTMGHSRGGEGVVRNYQINQDEGLPYGINAVLPLAPVDFYRPVINKVPLDVILPYCDGDVSDLQGVHFYDDARYLVKRDNTPKYYQEFVGANHNHFNTVWTPGEFPAGTWNDTTCSSFAWTAAEQRDAGEAYMAAFFRMHLGGETAFKPYFDGTDNVPASLDFAQDDVHTAYHAPAKDRLDVNPYVADSSTKKNELGGTVKAKKLSPFDLCGGPPPREHSCQPISGTQQPHTTGSAPGLSQLRYGWDKKGASMTNAIPGKFGDVSKYDTLTFRAGRNFSDARNPAGVAPDFNVVLIDGSGNKKAIAVGKWSRALFAQPGSGSGLPKTVLSTVRIPLSKFKGVDLTDVSKVVFKHNKKKTGAILTTDISFTDE
jgi:hypothetical protein